MTEIVKSLRMYKMCITGLPFNNTRTHMWAFRTTWAYRRSRTSILRENELGYTHQVKNAIFGGKK